MARLEVALDRGADTITAPSGVIHLVGERTFHLIRTFCGHSFGYKDVSYRVAEGRRTRVSCRSCLRVDRAG